MSKTPIRMCIACRSGKPKGELLRLTAVKNGTVTLDRTKKAPGRGAYLCRSLVCLERAVKIRAIQRALRAEVDIESLKSELCAEIEGVD